MGRSRSAAGHETSVRVHENDANAKQHSALVVRFRDRSCGSAFACSFALAFALPLALGCVSARSPAFQS
eukprot:15441449-Alexandrium_andersonii.AAC.1